MLLKNEGDLLPLRKDLRSIAVIGPNADDPEPARATTSPRWSCRTSSTVLEGIRAKLEPRTRVTLRQGLRRRRGRNATRSRPRRRRRAEADVAIVVVGENEWQAPGKTGTDGEGFDAATLELTGLQEELVKAVLATGTPTVVVLVNGRPLAIRWIAEHVPARSSRPGCPARGAARRWPRCCSATTNPSGRLPVTVPRHVGQLPVYYNHKPSKAYWLQDGWGKPYVDLSPEPLFPFGHGLSYTRFDYANLRLDAAAIRRDGTVEVSVDVANVGARPGREVVQLYVRDVVTSVVPVRRLRGFEKVALAPGETRTVPFTLRPDDLALLDAGLRGRSSPAPSRSPSAARAGRPASPGASRCYPREVRGAGRAIAAAAHQPGRKVRTPQGSVLANGQRGDLRESATENTPPNSRGKPRGWQG